MRLLEVEGLRLHYTTPRGVVQAVGGISFGVGEGEGMGVVGESGSGKTSLALALLRLLPRNVCTYEGSVFLEGRELMGLSDDEVRRSVRWKRVSLVFQGAMNSLNPVLKVGDQVAEPLLLGGSSGRQQRHERVLHLLDIVGLPPEVFHRYAHELSGGMKQRVLLAMALVLNPKLVILDEPTSALDVSTQAQIMNMLKRLKQELGLSLLFITHDIALASDLCDYMAVMYAGELVEVGAAEEVLLTPRHPYTQRLLASVPRLRSTEKPQFIPGSPPDLTAPPSGCRFHPRCPYAFQRCREESPPAFRAREGQAVRCWLVSGEGEP